MVSAASLALTLRVAQRIKKQSVDYTSVKEKLIQSWRKATLNHHDKSIATVCLHWHQWSFSHNVAVARRQILVAVAGRQVGD